jgi:hypothetical protein
MELPIIIEINLIKVTKEKKGRIGREAGWLDIVSLFAPEADTPAPPSPHVLYSPHFTFDLGFGQFSFQFN